VTAVCVGFASNMATRLLVDLKTEKRLRAEVTAFDKELKEAIAKKEKEKEEKLKKKKAQMDQMRLKASSGRMKVTLVTFVPFILIYYLIAGYLGGLSVVVAFSPIPIPYISCPTFPHCAHIGTMPLFWWYSLSSFSFTFILQKLLGTSPT
jgi:uncharacterized membrane protein (DUF106 family)